MMPKYDNVDPELSHIELKKADARFLRRGILFGVIQMCLTTIGFQFGSLPPNVVAEISTIMIGIAGALLFIFWWLGRVADSYRYVYPIRFLMICLIQLSCLAIAYFAPTHFSLSSILIFNVASGAIIGSWGMLGLYFGLISTAWAWILFQRMDLQPVDLGFAIILFVSSLGVAVMLHIVRRSTLQELIHTRLAEQKHTQELEATRVELELQKQQLTNTVAELEQSRIVAESASRAKSNFLAMMSHEIRTPMNGVMGMASLLANTELKVEQQEYLATINTSGESLLNIINDILDFSKVEAASLRLDSTSFNLPKCVKDALDLFIPLALEKQLNLSYQISEDTPEWLIGDPNRLKQILMNLVNNSIKFTEQGSVTISVSLHEGANMIEKDKANLHFAIKDTGIGIPTEKLGNLFEPFTQLDTSTTRKYRGTGLGLAISKRLSELMGGTMWVESCMSMGSTFHFSAQLQRCTPEQQQLMMQLDRSIQEHHDNNKLLISHAFAEQYPLRILIAEDNSVNQKVERLLLERLGYKVEIVNNGLEAVNAAQCQQYDLILMDIQMPEMDGLEATRKIRSLYLTTDPLCIVAMTAATMPEEVGMIFEAGMDAYISKPINMEILVEQLKACHENLNKAISWQPKTPSFALKM